MSVLYDLEIGTHDLIMVCKVDNIAHSNEHIILVIVIFLHLRYQHGSY